MASKKNLKRKQRKYMDIHQQHRLCEELIEAGARMRAVLDMVPDAHLPKAPLARATVELLNQMHHTWMDKIRIELEEEDAEKK